MICLARTLPTPGIDSSSAETFILPTTSFVLALLEHLGERGAGVLEPVLDLGPLPARRGGLLERGSALFGGEGRKSHAYVTSDVELSDTDQCGTYRPAPAGATSNALHVRALVGD